MSFGVLSTFLLHNPPGKNEIDFVTWYRHTLLNTPGKRETLKLPFKNDSQFIHFF